MTDTESTRQEEHYAGQIKGGLRPCMRLVVMGIVHKQAKRSAPHLGLSPGALVCMVVTVSCPPQGEGEEEEEGDVGLQMTVNFPEKAVRRNYRMAGKWGNCESALSFFPFASGEAFKMEIVCEHQQFRVLVDGQPLCGFTHRVTQLASLTSLRVVGDLQLTKVA